MKRVFIILATVMLVACAALAPAYADIALTSGNSTATVDVAPDGIPGGGVVNWVTDNTFIQFQQQYFVGVGAAGVQTPMDQMTFVANSPSIVSGTFVSAAYTAQQTISLLGGAANSGVSDISEQFQITNNLATTSQFRVYLYTDFDLGGIAAQDTATITNGASALQVGVTNPGMSVFTTLNPSATLVEASTYPSTINHLLSGAVYNLNGVTSAGPGDATWAVEYVFDLAPRASFNLSIDERVVVPVPPTVLLMGSGLLGLGLLRFRRKNAA